MFFYLCFLVLYFVFYFSFVLNMIHCDFSLYALIFLFRTISSLIQQCNKLDFNRNEIKRIE